MPKIDYQHPHQLAGDEVKRRMEKVQADLASKYGLKFVWETDTLLKVSGKGVKGDIRIESSQVLVKLDLSFLLSPIKGRIESRLREQMSAELV